MFCVCRLIDSNGMSEKRKFSLDNNFRSDLYSTVVVSDNIDDAFLDNAVSPARLVNY